MSTITATTTTTLKGSDRFQFYRLLVVLFLFCFAWVWDTWVNCVQSQLFEMYLNEFLILNCLNKKVLRLFVCFGFNHHMEIPSSCVPWWCCVGGSGASGAVVAADSSTLSVEGGSSVVVGASFSFFIRVFRIVFELHMSQRVLFPSILSTNYLSI